MTGLNWDNTNGPAAGDLAIINSGTVLLSTGSTPSLNGLRLLGGTLTFAGGTYSGAATASVDSHVNGTLLHTGTVASINELEIGRTAGSTGLYRLSGGSLTIARGLNGYSLYLGGNKSAVAGGAGTLEISGGTFRTRSSVKLGDATQAGTGTFTVLGSAVSEIGIATSTGDTDGTWRQHAGSTLKVGIDFGGVTPIFIKDSAATTGAGTNGTSAVFESGALLDVGYYSNGYGGGTWTVMEVENGRITNNGLAFASGVNTNIWSFSIDNSGSNGLLKVTAVGEPAAIALNVGSTRKQKMRYGLDYERLWFWSGSTANKNTVARWSMVDCDVDYIRVAINAKYELTEGVFDLDAYFDNDNQTSNDRIIPMMQAMKAQKPDIKFFASPRPLNEAYPNQQWEGEDVTWQPYPIWITGASTPTNSNFNFNPTKCGEYLVRYLVLMKTNGFDITYLDVSNEWQSNTGTSRVTPSDVQAIRNYLLANLPPNIQMPLLVAPSSWSYTEGTSWINAVNSQGYNSGFDIAASHNTDKGGTAAAFAAAAADELPGKEIWNTEVHGWKSTSGADEVLSSAYMFECIRAGFSGLNGWLAIGQPNQGHCYFINTNSTVTRNVKYFIFRKLSTTSNYGHALDINQPAEFSVGVGSDQEDAGTSTAALIRGNLMTVWVMNHSSNSLPIRINPTGRTLSENRVKRTRWSEVAGLPVEGVADHVPASTNTSVWSSIEGNSRLLLRATARSHRSAVHQDRGGELCRAVRHHARSHGRHWRRDKRRQHQPRQLAPLRQPLARHRLHHPFPCRAPRRPPRQPHRSAPRRHQRDSPWLYRGARDRRLADLRNHRSDSCTRDQQPFDLSEIRRERFHRGHPPVQPQLALDHSAIRSDEFRQQPGRRHEHAGGAHLGRRRRGHRL
jgi:hypothetical protein